MAETILGLAEDPKLPSARKLAGTRDFYRIRVGDYRVVYELQQEALIVLIIKVAHRREAYRNL